VLLAVILGGRLGVWRPEVPSGRDHPWSGSTQG
jgi:hypothetical protein